MRKATQILGRAVTAPGGGRGDFGLFRQGLGRGKALSLALLLGSTLMGAVVPAPSAMAQQRPAAASGEAPSALIADRVRVEGDSRLVAEGSVEVLHGTARLRASRITYDRSGGRLLIDGPITLIEGERALLLASAAELSDDLRNGVLRSARLVLDEQVQLAAASVRRVDGRYTELSNTVVSSCEVCAKNPVPLWSIRAKRVVHDADEQRIWFENASFRLGRVPVLWLPRMSLPDPTVERMSGFLSPEVRTTSQLGYGVKIPYFQTLGPSRDLLIRPYLSEHTRTLELRYRQALRSGKYELNGAVSRDDIRPDDTRAYLFGEGSFALPKGFTLRFNLELASDPSYLLDYGFSGKDRLTSFIRADRISRDEKIIARLMSFSTLRDDEIPIEDTLPFLQGQVSWERRHNDVLGGDGRLALMIEGHQRRSHQDQDGRDVLRIGGSAEWIRTEIFGPGFEIESLGRVDIDGYQVSEDSRWPENFTQITPAASVTLRYPLAGRTASGAISVIEPVAQLAWSDSWGKAPPNEDSTLVEFDEGNLLSLDRFPGSDRHEVGLRGVIGASWTQLGPDWSLGLAAGRIFRSEGADFSTASGLQGTASDWLLAAHATWDNHLSLATRMILDEEDGIAKSETRLGYKTDRISFSLGHVYLISDEAEGRTTDTNEITFDSDWTASTNWFGSTGFRYDVDVDRTSNANFGLGYRNECISAALSLSRRFTSSTSVEPTTSVGLTVSLNGFGNDGRAYRRTCRG